MKNKFAMSIIMIASIFLVMTFLFSVSNIQADDQTNVTKEMALQAINESEKIIKEMQENNLSVNSMEDSLIEAKRVFQQAEYAEILRNDSLNYSEKTEAREALRLVKWQDITYGAVLSYTEDIKNDKEKAFLLLDKLSVEENKLNEASNETKAIFEQAKLAFSEERYNDTEKLLDDFEKAVEKEKAENSILSGMTKATQNFFQRYWIQILVVLILILIIGYFVYKKIEKKRLREKIRKMRTEEQVLNDLMKKTQTERFKENKISGLVYDIRMKKYQKRLQEIKEELPVWEGRLIKLKRNVKKKI